MVLMVDWGLLVLFFWLMEMVGERFLMVLIFGLFICLRKFCV